MNSGNFWNYLRSHKSDRGFAPCGLPRPTDAVPGTAAKIAVLTDRLQSGLELHHPRDRNCFRDSHFFWLDSRSMEPRRVANRGLRCRSRPLSDPGGKPANEMS